jgi:hypothetical protein
MRLQELIIPAMGATQKPSSHGDGEGDFVKPSRSLVRLVCVHVTLIVDRGRGRGHQPRENACPAAAAACRALAARRVSRRPFSPRM